MMTVDYYHVFHSASKSSTCYDLYATSRRIVDMLERGEGSTDQTSRNLLKLRFLGMVYTPDERPLSFVSMGECESNPISDETFFERYGVKTKGR